MFPKITHIDQVREAIAGMDEFYIADRGTHFIANYNVNFSTSFRNPEEEGIDANEREHRLIRRECRGIIFDANGNLIRRPYHKFFNFGEKGDETPFDFSADHAILEKLDGSMIAPYRVNDELIYGTKMGLTDVAKPVHEFVKTRHEYNEFVNEMIDMGNCTPIFEWCSRKQRIVIDYPNDMLVLTAIRSMNTGDYFCHKALVEFGNYFNIPVVKSFGKVSEINQFLKDASDVKGFEGYVVRFDGGRMTKIKATEYVLLHKTLDSLRSEKDAVALILNNKLDDAKPLLPDFIVKAADAFNDALTSHILKLSSDILNKVSAYKNAGMTVKDFALDVVKSDPEVAKYSPVYFSTWNKNLTEIDDVYSLVVDQILKSCSTLTKLDANRYWINGLRWADYIELANVPDE